MKRLPEAVTTKFTELFSALHNAADDLKMAGAEASLDGDFSQVTVIMDSSRKLQVFEEEIKTCLKNFDSKHKARLHKKKRYRTRKSGDRLRVKVADKVIEEPTIAETFVETLKVFGLERVSKLNKVISSAPLISRTPASGYQAQRRCDGWYITTHVNKRTATTALEEIGKDINLPVEIEFVER